MDYTAHYLRLMAKAESRVLTGYVERHHVIPKCLEPNNDTVRLTPEEHFVAHQLLVRIFPGNHKLIYAAVRMTQGTQNGARNNKMYGWLRRKWMAVMRQPWTAKRRDAQTAEVNEKIAAARRGNPPWNKGIRKPPKVKNENHRVERLAARSIVENLNKLRLVERNLRQKEINSLMSPKEREAYRQKQSYAAKKGWEKMRANILPEELSAQRKASAIASYAKRGIVAVVRLPKTADEMEATRIARVQRSRAIEWTPEQRAKLSAACLLREIRKREKFAADPSLKNPISEENKRRGREKQVEKIANLETEIANLKSQTLSTP